MEKQITLNLSGFKQSNHHLISYGFCGPSIWALLTCVSLDQISHKTEIKLSMGFSHLKTCMGKEVCFQAHPAVYWQTSSSLWVLDEKFSYISCGCDINVPKIAHVYWPYVVYLFTGGYNTQLKAHCHKTKRLTHSISLSTTKISLFLAI